MPTYDPEFSDYEQPGTTTTTTAGGGGEIDLSSLDEVYKTAPEKKEFGDVPDGRYQARVARVEFTRAKSSGNPMLKWGLKILAGPYANQWLWRQNVIITPENVKFLKGDLYVCGVTLSSLNDLNKAEVREKLIGVTVEVSKQTKAATKPGSDPIVNVYINKRIEVAAGGNGSRPAGAPGVDEDIPF